MDIFTGLFGAFTIILYAYLFLLKKELVFVAKRKSIFSIVAPLAVAGFIAISQFFSETLDEKIKGLFAALLILSYLINGRGMTEDRFVTHSLDNRGIKFTEIDRVVLFQDTKEKVVRINFFKRGLRGPLMKFSDSIEEIANFLKKNLKEGTPIDVITQDKKS